MTKSQDATSETPSEANAAPAAQAIDYAEHFGTMRVLGEILRTEDRRPWLTSVSKTPEHRKYVIWLGCNVLRVAHLAETLDDILNYLKEDFVTLGGPSNCCGIIHEANGDLTIANNMLRNTVNKIESFTSKQMLYWCPSCDNQLRVSPAKQETELTKARISVVQFLSQQLPRMDLQAVNPMRIAIHTHGGFYEQENDACAARTILSQIPGIEVIDMPSITRERHCTEESIHKLGKVQYIDSLREWTREAKRLGASHMMSIYHSCHRQMLLAARNWDAEERLPVTNYLTVLAQALQLAPRVDKFAHCADVNDIDQMLADVEADLAARGVRPALAKRALTAQFGS